MLSCSKWLVNRLFNQLVGLHCLDTCLLPYGNFAWKHNKPILHISPVTALRAMRLASSTFEARPITVIVLGPLLFLARMDTLHPVAVRIRSACAAVKLCLSWSWSGSAFNTCCSVTSWSFAGSTAMSNHIELASMLFLEYDNWPQHCETMATTLGN
jgi:hypothetical protein